MNKASEAAEILLEMLKGIDKQFEGLADIPFGKRKATEAEQKDILMQEIERLEQGGI